MLSHSRFRVFGTAKIYPSYHEYAATLSYLRVNDCGVCIRVLSVLEVKTVLVDVFRCWIFPTNQWMTVTNLTTIIEQRWIDQERSRASQVLVAE